MLAVLFFEDAGRPLALESLGGVPVLRRTAQGLARSGVSRAFLAASPQYAAELLACFPPEAAAEVSDRHDRLMAFLDTPEEVLVLRRAMVPLDAAGLGMAYAAPGRSLREVWRERLTNAIQDARLVPGWLPLYGPETLAELEPRFQGQD